MKKLLFLISLLSVGYAEPSAFLAGDLDSDNPYGLTKDEKYIWQNKQAIKKLTKLVNSQQQIIDKQSKELKRLKIQFLNYKLKVDNLAQQVDGVKSILPLFDNVSLKVENIKKDLNSTNRVLFALKDEVNNLKTNVNENKKINDSNIQTIIALIEKLATNVDKIEKEIDKKIEEKIKEKNDFRNWPLKDIFSKAVYNFNHSELTKAKEMFLYLNEKKYKLPYVLFYLGEIEYKRGHYKTALAYYKKTIKLTKNNTYYMDDLLYHTGYSFEKLGNIEAAKKSYMKLVQDYPKSILVKYAKKRIENLEKSK